jgi:glycerol-1-phosphate dehydrogenase [NAD(P)+]
VSVVAEQIEARGSTLGSVRGAGDRLTLHGVPTETRAILGDRVLGRELSCSCGREHRVLTREVVIEPEAARRLPEVLARRAAGRRVLLVADRRTWEAAGAEAGAALAPTWAVERCLLRDGPGGAVHASVELVDELAAGYPDAFDAYLAVGSGTVNDLVKELAHRRSRPYAVLATAASMNGYTSGIVALLERGLKTTGEATPPVAVLGDPRVLAAAPRELSLAGLGDLVSKPYCGCDWLIASLVRGEYHCPLPDRLLTEPFERGLEIFPGLAAGEPEAVVELFRLLLVSGIAMAVTGTSSPASGAEHLLSHCWDMTRLRDGRPLNLHGAQVGVASLVIDRLYGEILEQDFAAATFRASPGPEAAEREIRAGFGSLAAAVWPQWRAKLGARTRRDLEGLQEHERPIKEHVRRTLELGAKVRAALTAAGAPLCAADLGIGDDELAAALRLGRTIRARFTALDVAAELGILEGFAGRLAAGG